jgi:hypothetical protein
MEDRTSGNPNELPPIFGLLLDRSTRTLVTSEVVVPILYGLRFVKLLTLGDFVRRFGAGGRWNRDYALFTCDDEVTKVSSVCTVEPVFQSLIKGLVGEG